MPPTPPETQNLSPDQFKTSKGLETFFDVLILVATKRDLNPRTCRFKFSLAQDLVYAVTDGRVKTPKSILFLCTIKTLTDSTELVNVVKRFDHGVSYTALMELFTYNAIK